MARPICSHPPRALLLVLIGLASWTTNTPAARGAPPAQYRAVQYRAGVILVQDDPARSLESTLVELCRRRSGRAMIQRLLDSGFVTVLVSKPLRPMQAGLWGPIFHLGRIVGASLYIDLVQIRGFDHDPTGVETLAHELRHQVDASRAFLRSGAYRAVYLAARSGDRTRSAQRYGRRVRHQKPDLTPSRARRWLLLVPVRFEPRQGIRMASAATSTEP